jgi:hypothetical protein
MPPPRGERAHHPSPTGTTTTKSSERSSHMVQKKKSININYVPHNEFIHRETRHTDDDWDDVMFNLSTIVGGGLR